MKLRKSSILIIGISILLLSSMTVSAETDAPGDVFHWKGFDWHNWNWNVVDRPNIDIIDISYLIEDRLTVSMSVAGNFNTGLSLYHLWFNSSDAYYHVSYNPESGVDPIVIAFPTDFTPEDLATWEPPETDVSVDVGTLTATIDWITEDHTMTGFYGWAQEWDIEGEMAVEAWYDFAPNDYAWFGDYDDYYSGNGGSENPPPSGTPGFETLATIAALGVALIILRRKN